MRAVFLLHEIVLRCLELFPSNFPILLLSSIASSRLFDFFALFLIFILVHVLQYRNLIFESASTRLFQVDLAFLVHSTLFETIFFCKCSVLHLKHGTWHRATRTSDRRRKVRAHAHTYDFEWLIAKTGSINVHSAWHRPSSRTADNGNLLCAAS